MAWSSCASGTLAVSFFSLFLLAVGFSIPFWVNFSQKDVVDTSKTQYSVYTGVWYLMVCKEGESGSCASEPIAPDFETDWGNITFYFSGEEQDVAAQNGVKLLCRFIPFILLEFIVISPHT